jgi:hypothetical protein
VFLASRGVGSSGGISWARRVGCRGAGAPGDVFGADGLGQGRSAGVLAARLGERSEGRRERVERRRLAGSREARGSGG